MSSAISKAAVVLEASSVTHRFSTITAVDELNLQVRSGQLFCLLGANGAGKTTTINLFLGFLSAHSGAIRVAGIDPATDPISARALVAYIPENVALYPQLTGLENIAVFCKLGGRTLQTDQLEALLHRTGLSRAQMLKPVAIYSKGMRQKVGLAIAYASEAKALLLDEPLSGLDPAAANEFCAELETLRAHGAAILMTTHDLFRAKELGGSIGIMRNGRLLEVLQANEIDAADLERVYLHHMRSNHAPAVVNA